MAQEKMSLKPVALIRGSLISIVKWMAISVCTGGMTPVTDPVAGWLRACIFPISRSWYIIYFHGTTRRPERLHLSRNRFARPIKRKQNLVHSHLLSAVSWKIPEVEVTRNEDEKRRRKSTEKKWEGIVQCSQFPHSHWISPLTLVSPRGNLFIVNAALMSRKDPEMPVGRRAVARASRGKSGDVKTRGWGPGLHWFTYT